MSRAETASATTVTGDGAPESEPPVAYAAADVRRGDVVTKRTDRTAEADGASDVADVPQGAEAGVMTHVVGADEAVDVPPGAGVGAMTDGEAARRAPGETAVASGPGGRGGGAARAFARLLGSELRLLFRRPRNLAALGVLAVVPVLLGIAVRVAGPEEADGGPAIVAQVAGNGLFLAFASMFFLVPLLLPIAVAVIAGDAVAGEANSGTLRYLLTAPAGRTRLLTVKYASVVVYALVASLVVVASGLVTGLLMFPSGPMTLLSGTTVPFTEGLLRMLIVVGYVTVGMAAIGAVGLAISTLTEVPIGAIAATATLVIVAQVLQAIPQLAVIEPFLVTSYWNDFDGALREPIATADMGTGLLVFAAYIAIFGSFAWARFTGRDVTS